MNFPSPPPTPSTLSNVSPNFSFQTLTWYNGTFSGPGIWSFRAGSAPSPQWPFITFFPTPCLSWPWLKGTYGFQRVRDREIERGGRETKRDEVGLGERERENPGMSRTKSIWDALSHSGWLVHGWSILLLLYIILCLCVLVRLSGMAVKIFIL